MAEYIKFRVSAAKVGVSMALMALIAGVAEKIQAAPAQVRATPAAATTFLKLQGISGNTKSAFLKLEMKYLKLQSALSGVENQLALKYLKIKDASAEFLTITDASDKWLKIDTANAEFLKIDQANGEFLKLDDANANFLKIDDANAQFLKITNGIQGHGNVITNELQDLKGQTQTLLGDGSVRVLMGHNVDGASTLILENDTNQPLNVTVNGAASSPQTPIPPGGQTAFTPGSQNDIQMFGSGGGAGKVWTATVSQAGGSFVGQMLIGNL